MLRLDLTSEPRWLDLGHGVRLRAAPLTTALMVAARSDPAVEAQQRQSQPPPSGRPLRQLPVEPLVRGLRGQRGPRLALPAARPALIPDALPAGFRIAVCRTARRVSVTQLDREGE